MKHGQKIIRFPENLEVKALLTVNRIEVTDMAARIGRSRMWVSQVLNGNRKGKSTINLIKQELNKSK